MLGDFANPTKDFGKIFFTAFVPLQIKFVRSPKQNWQDFANPTKDLRILQICWGILGICRAV
jgi:hypothetical protein